MYYEGNQVIEWDGTPSRFMQPQDAEAEEAAKALEGKPQLPQDMQPVPAQVSPGARVGQGPASPRSDITSLLGQGPRTADGSVAQAEV